MNVNIAKQEKNKDNLKPISLYHSIQKHHDFDTSAQDLFELVKSTQKRFPNQKRLLYINIEGHRVKSNEFDEDMEHLQRDFLFGFLFQYCTLLSFPLGIVENHRQKNELPESVLVDREPLRS